MERLFNTSSLKIGDKVIFSGRSGNHVGVVEKITPSGLVDIRRISAHGYTTRYNADGGLRGGDAWTNSNLYEWTQEEEDRINQMARTIVLIAKIKKFDFNSLPLETLEAIYELTNK